MKQLTLKINSIESHQKGCRKLMEWFNEHKYLRVSVLPGKNRSAEQNATWSGMYKALWIQCAFESFLDARAYCKLHIGVPILERDSPGFKESFNKIFGKIKYEDQLRLMNKNKLFPVDGFPVTSNFGVKQGIEYIENIVKAFSGADTDSNFKNNPYVDFSEILDKAE